MACETRLTGDSNFVEGFGVASRAASSVSDGAAGGTFVGAVDEVFGAELP
jgi:hypothetical protein